MTPAPRSAGSMDADPTRSDPTHSDVTRSVPAHADPTDADRLLRQLPEAASRTLPADRHAQHRETFMQHIRTEAAAEPETGTRRARRTAPTAPLAPTAKAATQRFPKAWRPAAFSALAVTAAAAVAVTAIAQNHGGASHGSTSTPTVALQPGDMSQAAVVLDQMATAAGAAPATPVAAAQFVYVKTLYQYAQEYKKPWTMQPPTTRETWYAQAPGTHRGMFRENGQDGTMDAAVPAGQDTVPPVANPTAAWAATLPADPRRVLDIVHAGLDADFEYSDNVREFLAIGKILTTTVPTPKAEATLYRAAALIPGVEAVADATDAAGRHGFGIAIEDNLGERHEWIFQAGTYRYLGERDYLTKDTDGGKAGMLVGLTAVLDRGIADAEGQAPVSDLG